MLLNKELFGFQVIQYSASSVPVSTDNTIAQLQVKLASPEKEKRKAVLRRNSRFLDPERGYPVDLGWISYPCHRRRNLRMGGTENVLFGTVFAQDFIIKLSQQVLKGKKTL